MNLSLQSSKDIIPENKPGRCGLLLLQIFALILCLSAALSAQSTTSSKALELPRGNTPIEIQSYFHLLAVPQINDEDESFKFSGILTLIWKDERQAFDPTVEGVQEKQYHGNFQCNELSPSWYPQVILVNAVDFTDPQGVLLRVKPDGTNILIQTITAEARTRLKLRSFPFDSQKLEATFAILGFDESQAILTAPEGDASSDFSSIQIPQWDLIGISSSVSSTAVPYPDSTDNSSFLTITLDTKRQAFFMMRLVILPLALIVILSWSVFWMDRASLGDRMSVSFVGILTAVAYQIMVSDIMPQISYVTLVNAIISFSLLLMSATVFINLYVGSLDKKGEFQRGERVDLRCRFLFPLIYLVMIAYAAFYTVF